MFQIGDIVRVKDGYKGMLSFNYLLNSKEAHEIVELCQDGLKVKDSYFLPTVYFEIIEENVQMFDLMKDKWFIRTPTQEISKLVQEWLFEQGVYWGQNETYIKYTEGLGIGSHDSYTGHLAYASIECWVRQQHKEIKLTFKTIVESVEYPETTTPEQQQLTIVFDKLKQLQSEAEQLQAIINKEKV